jgi:23S rRNA pseudouridine2605 synthase
VRRMLEAVGHRVRRLHRSRYGPLTLEGLEPRAWRELEPSEVATLRSTPDSPTRAGGRASAGSAPGRSRPWPERR